MFIKHLPSLPLDIPKTAMILAAGHGKRMLPLTERIPKPMLVIVGKTILDRAIDNLFAVGIDKIVINVSHLASVIIEHIRSREDNRIILSEEDIPLETGGGVINALPKLGNEPFFIINGDSVWVDGMKNTLLRLAEKWSPNNMDALLMLASTAKTLNFDGLGDFFMDQNGFLKRRKEKTISPYAYMGLSIINPLSLANAPNGAFSLNWLYDKAIESQRLAGIIHDGLWYHISTPGDLEFARVRFADGHLKNASFF